MVPASAIARIRVGGDSRSAPAKRGKAHVRRRGPKPGRAPEPKRRSRTARILTSRWLAWGLAVVLVGGTLLFAREGFLQLTGDVADLERQLDTARVQVGSLNEQLLAAREDAALAQQRAAKLADRVAALREAKVRTVVKTEKVTKTVAKWVPNGKKVSVEITGFEGQIAIHDVQLTHAYGYTDLIGIAINESDQTIAYTQLGCTFLDADGRVVANQITNRENWAPGATWGFVCSAQTDATGGILRVDEMT